MGAPAAGAEQDSGPRLSIVVCTYNRADLLPGCLESLAAQTLLGDHYEVIVVDNNSSDSTGFIAEAFAAAHRSFRVIPEPKQGLSHARNHGWQEASGELVAFLDDDARADPDWAERIVNAFDSVWPQPAAVGGEIHPLYEASPPAWFTDEFETRTWGARAGFLEPPRARFGFSGSNMAFRKELLAQHGGFSPRFGMTGRRICMGEETDLFQRIYQHDPHFYYDPAICVRHWTPLRNTRFSYRFWRSFRAGESNAKMQEKQRLSLDFIIGAAATVGLVARSPLMLIRSGGPMHKRLMRFVEDLGGRLGYLRGFD